MNPLRRHYLIQNIFGFWLGISTFTGGVVFIAIPRIRRASAIAHVAYRLDWAWSCMYLAGGILTVAGIITMTIRYEVAGKLLLATALVLSSTALLYYRGAVAIPTSLVSYALAAACLVRACVLVDLQSELTRALGPRR